jgi:hypothetical protein
MSGGGGGRGTYFSFSSPKKFRGIELKDIEKIILRYTFL